MHHLLRQIERLKKTLLPLGAMVEEALHDATKALRELDADLARKVIAGDKNVDVMEVDLEEECLHTLALHQPVAYDLRFVVAVLKINNDLERIGDLAASIAEQAVFMCELPEVTQVPFDLAGMSQRVELMLHKSLDALINIDVAEARDVRALDDEVDAIHREMYQNMLKAMCEYPDRLEQYMHLTNVSRNLERAADHAVNIAKDVLYMAEGEIVRHAKARAAARG